MPLSVAFPQEAAADKAAMEQLARRRAVGLLFGLTVLTVLLAITAYDIQVRNGSRHSWAFAIVAAASAFVFAGAVAWLRRPANRLGPLLLAAGVALLLRQFRYSHEALLFTVFFLLGDIGYALVGHSILAYPTGRVSGVWLRRLVFVGYATVLVFPLSVLLFHARGGQLAQIEPGSPGSVLRITDRSDVAYALQKAGIVFFFGVLASLWISAIVYRLWRATPRARRMLAPLVLAAFAIATRSLYEVVHTFARTSDPFAYAYLFWWWVTASFALPLVMLAGMLRARLARANVGQLVLELDQGPATPAKLQRALGRALADPQLELYFLLPETGGYVDASGRAVSTPQADSGRAVSRLEEQGQLVAVLVHDATLLEEPELIASAGAAARLALENARLHAQTQAQLEQVRESRKRIVTVADDERRRIERNLHDGAQQRLLALALQLSRGNRQLGADNPAIDELLAAAVSELQGTVSDLRELSRGLHPTVLTEYGLSGAIGALTARAPLPVSLAVGDERYPAAVEACCYFIVSEALQNVIKHAGAETASVSVHRKGDRLFAAVADDGHGGAKAGTGSGLQGMADRVEALGGKLQVTSSADAGTCVAVEIPCAP